MSACAKYNKYGRAFLVLVEAQAMKEMFKKGELDARRVKSFKPRDTTHHIRGGIIENFKMDVNTAMTPVSEHIIEPPKMKVGDQNGRIMTVMEHKYVCDWNLPGKSSINGKPINHWAIIDFTSSESDSRFKLRQEEFIPRLKDTFRSLGISMNDTLWVEKSSMKQLETNGSISALLEKVDQVEVNHGDQVLLLCVMSRKHYGYKMLKWISETKVGVVTQCCLLDTVNTWKDHNLTNLALKINAKLGGSNFELKDRLLCGADDGHVIFIGADVNHPAAGDVNSSLIAAVVGTVNWPAANRYTARVMPQSHREEQILEFGTICHELVTCYRELNGVRPKQLNIFRDGVDETQFDMVLNEELRDLKRVYQTKDYNPTITLIVTQKRHRTRFSPKQPSGNVPPGTVVDTRVVHPVEFDFYLCSHYGTLGTSKPTHCHVLWDERGFSL